MSKLHEAARQALEALEGTTDFIRDDHHVWAAVTALREALEQPAQAAEPVAGVVIDGSLGVPALVKLGTEDKHIANWGGSRLYTTPQPARQPLTQEQMYKARTDGYDAEDCPDAWAFTQGVRFAERHHGITGGQHVE